MYEPVSSESIRVTFGHFVVGYKGGIIRTGMKTETICIVYCDISYIFVFEIIEMTPDISLAFNTLSIFNDTVSSLGNGNRGIVPIFLKEKERKISTFK